jgi:antitoxin CptB
MEEGKIRWQCRRGILELELLLLKFFDEDYQTLSPQQKIEFSQLLQEPDPVLQAWLLGQGWPESAAWQALIQRIRMVSR